jgi:hypothetical protein
MKNQTFNTSFPKLKEKKMAKKFFKFGLLALLLTFMAVTAFANKDVTVSPGFYTAGDPSLGMWNIIYIGDRHADDTVFVSLHPSSNRSSAAWEGTGTYTDGYKIKVRGTYYGTTLGFDLEVYSGTALRYKGNIYRKM